MKSVVLNLGLFKAAWLATILGAAASAPQLGLVAIAVVVGVHLARSQNAQAEALLLGLAALMGLGWESILVAFDVLEYDVGAFVPGLAPYWIVAMWVLFATTLNVGMRWLRRNLLIAAIAGAVGGPLSFLAGASAGAVTLSDPVTSLIVIGIGWCVLLPTLVHLSMRFDGHAAQPA